MTSSGEPGQRISPPRAFGGAARAPRPPEEAAGAREAHRQTGFVLGAEIEAIVDGLNLEAAIAADSTAPKYRKHTTAAAMLAWSRSWLVRLEALHATEWGNYAAAMPLVRNTTEHAAAMALTLRDEGASWREWLATGGIGKDGELRATEFRLQPFRAAEVIAAEPELAAVFRVSGDLAMPYLGAAALLSASDSDERRIAATFGDRDFHVGLTELLFGWLHELGLFTLAEVAGSGRYAAPDGAALEGYRLAATGLMEAGNRCRAEVIDREGETRYLVHNWRRRAGGAPGRVLL